MNLRTAVRTAAAAAALLTLAAACGSDNDSSGATTTASSATTAAGASTTAAGSATTAAGSNEALCAARGELQTSIQGLKDINILQDGTNGLQAAATAIKDDLASVKAAASAELQPEVKAAEDAVTAFTTALGNAGSGGLASLATAGSALVQSGTTLLTSLQSLSC